jgi:WD40 repeat protein
MSNGSVLAPQHALHVLAIASGSTVTVWDIQNRDKGTTFDSFLPDGPRVLDLVWNHTGKVLCCVVQDTSIGSDIIALIAAQSGRLLSSFGKQTMQGSLAAAFGGKSRYLCIGNEDGSVLVWDLKKQVQARQFKISSPCLHACLDPTDAFVFALGDWNLSIYRLREATLVAEIQPTNVKHANQNQSSSLSCFAISLQAPYLTAVGSQAGRVWVYDLTSMMTTSSNSGSGSDSGMPPLKEWKLSHLPIVKLDFVGALNHLAVASESHVGVYEYESSNPLFEVAFDHETNTDKVTSMSCTGNLVAVGRASGKVLVWDWELQKQVGSLHFPAPVQSVVFAPQGTIIPVPAEMPSSSNDISDSNHILPHTRPRASPDTVPTNDTAHQEYPAQLARHGNVIGTSAVQEMIRDEVDRVREDMQDAFRNLHVDMLRQFQLQSEDLNAALARQLHAMDRLAEENQILREENRSIQQTNDLLRKRAT